MDGQFNASRRWVLAAGGSLALAACSGGRRAQGGPTLALSQEGAYAESVDAVRLPTAVRAAYKTEDLYWFDPGGRPRRQARQLYELLYGASYDGLQPGHYLTADLIDQGRVTSVDQDRLAATDRALTLGLYAYAGDLVQGRYKPNDEGRAALLEAGLTAPNLLSWYEGLEPRGRSYQSLKSVLARNDATPEMRSAAALNMERLRWTPEEDWSAASQVHIRVNIADAELEAFEGQRLVDSMRGVIGRYDRQTPQLVSPIRDLKFSPDWTIPDTVLERDYLPQLQADPAALDPNVYEVRVKGELPEAELDWSTVTVEDLFIRRASSDVGPLGGVRFSMYNAQAIFLHDSPQKALFEQDRRLYSSGCVRVERAEDLAVWISSKQPSALSREEIARRMISGRTSQVPLDAPIAVSLQYMTLWIDGRGALRTAPDIYKLDNRLARRMGLSLA